MKKRRRFTLDELPIVVKRILGFSVIGIMSLLILLFIRLLFSIGIIAEAYIRGQI